VTDYIQAGFEQFLEIGKANNVESTTCLYKRSLEQWFLTWVDRTPGVWRSRFSGSTQVLRITKIQQTVVVIFYHYISKWSSLQF